MKQKVRECHVFSGTLFRDKVGDPCIRPLGIIVERFQDEQLILGRHMLQIGVVQFLVTSRAGEYIVPAQCEIKLSLAARQIRICINKIQQPECEQREDPPSDKGKMHLCARSTGSPQE